MKYQRNGTKEWEEEYVEEDDYKYVMNRVRTEETTGADKNRKKKLILAQIGKVEKERAARKKIQRKKRERNAMLAKVYLIFDKDVIDGLKGQKLTDQIAHLLWLVHLFQRPRTGIKQMTRGRPLKMLLTSLD